MKKLTVRIGVCTFTLLTTVLAVAHENDQVRSLSGGNATSVNTTNVWIEDHQYKHQPHWKRLPDGKVVLKNDSALGSFEYFRGAVAAQTPWISKWAISTQGRRTLKKDLPRLLMYNLVSPMDYGSSLRSSNVRRRRNKAVEMFLLDNLALPLMTSLGRVAWNLIQSHYVGYFKDEMFAQRLKMMNSTELIRAFNLTLPPDAIEDEEVDEYRPNTTLVYNYNGESLRAQLYVHYTSAFSPYEEYSNRYYVRDGDMPPSTLPADSYPWLWSPRLNVARILASQLMQSVAIGADTVDNDTIINNNNNNATSESPSPSLAKKDGFPPKARTLTGDTASNEPAFEKEDVDNVETTVNGDEIEILEQIEFQLQEFHLKTGIPRFTNPSNASHSIFPTLASFLQVNMTASSNGSGSDGSGSENSGKSNQDAGFSLNNATDLEASDGAEIMTDFSTRSGVYAALVHFYAYPSVNNFVLASGNGCTLEHQCLVQSGVTVYTPSLSTLKLFNTFATNKMSSDEKRGMRLKALLEMVQIAFEAEGRALNHGLQGPSTVWYSNHDLDVDEFADAVLGTVNISVQEDSKPLHVFEYLMNEQVPILDEMVSYYSDTNYNTKVSMELNHSVPKLEKFNESELLELIGFMQSRIVILDHSIASYVKTRAANPQYQEVRNATIRGDLYNGSEYTLLGFGYIIPATNDKNVLYYDMKLPIPFHLVLRLIIRFQESCLLLPEESRQLLICLAMAISNISFYRCRPKAQNDE